MEILLTGVGGQGVVLASKILAYCAMERGMAVRSAETIGMAQRGGSVTSHVRIGNEYYSPLIPKGWADVLIGFEPAEAARCVAYLKPNAGAVVATRMSASMVTYQPEEVLEYLALHTRLTKVVTDELETKGLLKSLNIALLGAASRAGAIAFRQEELESAIRKMIPPRYVEMNLIALAGM
ncbi:MAG: indolepyruvate oxidoreductase subunit beta [Clostridium sp.]|jgi:indolepyruvate ferredoxin oxidoreductase beta subunit|nr:indolepyruvate oxidoreductase subunit beta [Clostridium sp.]